VREQKLLALDCCGVGFVSPGMCGGGVAERYAKGWPVMPKSTKGAGSSSSRGSTEGTGVCVRIGHVPAVGGDARLGEAKPGTGRG
jgi:hypothetical protein